jgi:hypothetical protein
MKFIIQSALVVFLLLGPQAAAGASSGFNSHAIECSPATTIGGAPELTRLDGESIGHPAKLAKLQADAFFVSLSGNDNWSGRLSKPRADGSDGPFATVERALSARRTSKAKDAAIYVRGGRYRLEQPIILTARDNGFKLIAYPGEHPDFTGASTFTDITALSGGLYRAALKDNPGQEIFVGGVRLTLAFEPSPGNGEGWRKVEGNSGQPAASQLTGSHSEDIAQATIEVYDKARSRNGFTRLVELAPDGTAAKLAPFYPEPVADVGSYRLLGNPAWVNAKGYFGWDQLGGFLVMAPPDAGAVEKTGIQVPGLESLMVLHGVHDASQGLEPDENNATSSSSDRGSNR